MSHLCSMISKTRDRRTRRVKESKTYKFTTLYVAQQICKTCAGIEDISVRCRWCRVCEFIFRNNPVKQFINLVTRTTKCFKKIICIAHNAKTFMRCVRAIHFEIFSWKFENYGRTTDNFKRDENCDDENTKFIDSVNYLPMRSDLPKAFGLKNTLDKGVFPIYLIQRRIKRTLTWYPTQYYSPDQMKFEERERFMKWHEEMIRSNFIFNFQLEIIKYCCNDVDILWRSCIAFRKIFLERDNVCSRNAQLSLSLVWEYFTKTFCARKK